MEQVQPLITDFLANLAPHTLGDVLIYLVFFISLITTFLLADGNNMAGNLLYATIVLAIFNLVVGSDWFYNSNDIVEAFSAYVALIAMFLLPLVAAGAARARKGKGKLAMPLAIVAGVIGMVHAVGAFAAADIMQQVLF